MNLLAAFRRRPGQDPAASARRRRAIPDWVEARLGPTAPSGDEDASAAPQSWHESSWVLRAGVSVTEHPVADLLVLTPSSPPCR